MIEFVYLPVLEWEALGLVPRPIWGWAGDARLGSFEGTVFNPFVNKARARA